jgi:hypothetical protein
MMKIFGKRRESLKVKKVRAARAVYMDGPGTEEIEITFLTEGNELLTLRMRPHLTHVLIRELASAYEAVAPPLRTNTEYAVWDGMQNG